MVATENRICIKVIFTTQRVGKEERAVSIEAKAITLSELKYKFCRLITTVARGENFDNRVFNFACVFYQWFPIDYSV